MTKINARGSVLLLCAGILLSCGIANAEIFSKTAEFTENDKGLICFYCTPGERASAKFNLVAAGASTDGKHSVISYEIRYTIGSVTCSANLKKYYIDEKGWATLALRSGLDCSGEGYIKP